MDYKKAYEEALERAKSYRKWNKSAVITAIFPELKESEGEQKDIINNQSDYVDLGLPSGTLWAKCNLGAEKETNFGKFFQWGDTQGYFGIDEHQFTWNDYKFGSWDNLNKYNENDTKLILENEDDFVFVATNGKFKTPTKEQLQELIENTYHEWSTIDGVGGMKFVNKSDDTKYIFIPAAGEYLDGNHFDVGFWGYIWSTSRNESFANYAWYLGFSVGYIGMDYFDRCDGFNIRGVANEPLK